LLALEDPISFHRNAKIFKNYSFQRTFFPPREKREIFWNILVFFYFWNEIFKKELIP